MQKVGIIGGCGYIGSGESFRISDIHRIMNDQIPKNKPVSRYSGKKAEQELGLTFKPVQLPLANFSV